ncbi:hypothetical protein [Flavobacterium capsici]|uniref:Uncharacterized protein n=1 Tax=Flavobacterium capsici TaxID=3075618 RepID=A0AA96J2Y4_9FLAO|nr:MULTISPECIES: hypothetical protein [unclassified Flavobacterium]WNM18673.1 hypothetical protein RN608_11735 [Flavobacterium sp. PMR2A8]WNM22724.1 hypothetical protein RN605_05035 [Flavobacterium sp. PMTSA4]
MNLKQSLIIAFILSAISIAAWEFYWRSNGKYPTLNEDKSLWAMHRADAETATKEDVIILGSSRAFFDIQIKTFEEASGKKPIQLACPGASPLPTFHDIVNNTNFNGTIIIGVTPGLFFSTTFPEAFPWKRSQSRTDYFKNRTYAQRLNFELSIPLQQNLVLMSAEEEEWDDDIDLKSLLRQVRVGENRTKNPYAPPFYYFGDTNLDRNMKMTNKTAVDTAFANSIIKVWHYFGKGAPPPDKKSTTAYFLEDLKKFKARNGTVLLIRCPSSGGVRMGENMKLPRKDFWDELVKQAQVKSYHFEDYEQFKHLTCPEESHLSEKDAIYFTRELVKLMKSDNLLTNSKTN